MGQACPELTKDEADPSLPVHRRDFVVSAQSNDAEFANIHENRSPSTQRASLADWRAQRFDWCTDVLRLNSG